MKSMFLEEPAFGAGTSLTCEAPPQQAPDWID